MKFVENYMNGRESKREALVAIDEEVASLRSNKVVSKENTDRIAELIAIRRTVKWGDIEAGDVIKVIGNLAVVGILIGFEMNHIMNQSGKKFLKVL